MNIRRAQLQDAPAIARVHIDTWKATFAGIVPQDYLDQLTYAESEEVWEDILQGEKGVRPFFVAEDFSKEVVGFVLGGASRVAEYPAYEGELIGIYILPAYQGQGLGRRLTQALIQALSYRSLLVWTLTQNPACRFYEALGAQLLGKDHTEIGGAILEVSIYGWSELHLLRNRI